MILGIDLVEVNRKSHGDRNTLHPFLGKLFLAKVIDNRSTARYVAVLGFRYLEHETEFPYCFESCDGTFSIYTFDELVEAREIVY